MADSSGDPLVGTLSADLTKQLASMAVGQGGDPDVFSATMDKQLAQAAASVTGGRRG